MVTDSDIQRARERHRMPSEAELRRLPIPAAPRIDQLPLPASRPSLDLESLARSFEAANPAPALGQPSGPSLLVFISFAMPPKTLQRLAEQAARTQATLVLRGLVDGSLTRTAAQVQALFGAHRTPVQIDPQAFDRYAVTATPSFVLVPAGAALHCGTSACAPAEAYALVSGDVTLDYALRHIERTAPGFAQDAQALLHRLER